VSRRWVASMRTQVKARRRVPGNATVPPSPPRASCGSTSYVAGARTARPARRAE
jgi:hypothetical protein